MRPPEHSSAVTTIRRIPDALLRSTLPPLSARTQRLAFRGFSLQRTFVDVPATPDLTQIFGELCGHPTAMPLFPFKYLTNFLVYVMFTSE